MPFFENGGVRIHYRDEGSGPPLLIIPGGGLNGSMGNMDETDFNPITEFSSEYRCISLDIRNGSGETTGPLDAERAWDQFTDDQLALLDHLGIGDFLLMGFCIGGPLNWNLMHRAPDRVKAAVMVHPSGYNPDDSDVFWKSNIGGWGKAVQDRNASVDQAQVEGVSHQHVLRSGRLPVHRRSRLCPQLRDASVDAAGRYSRASVQNRDGVGAPGP